MNNSISTGVKGIDQVIDGLRLGDNVVWQIGHIDEYTRLARIFCKQAAEENRTIVYFRFAGHQPIICQEEYDGKIQIFHLAADSGFESFTSQVYRIISQAGQRVFYIFDCLSELLEEWASDLMIGNFFRITCPYLFELDTIAYFSLYRGAHAYATIARIRETTQLLLDYYRISGNEYIHPLKVWQRYSPTMFLPHRIDQDSYQPISNSADAARLFSGTFSTHNLVSRQIDYWDRLFTSAEESDRPELYFSRLCELLIGNEGRIAALAKEKLQLEDLLAIKKRQIGTGKIGGKSVGMLLARKIIEQDERKLADSEEIMIEPHDSFFLGSDLFYTYIVQNGWWKLRTEQKSEDGYFVKAGQLQENLLNGRFPEFIKEQFWQMLEYFGQSPIIVRSSSLLEDNFGNAFAGKYESVFCVNQGSPEDRYQAFEQAVRHVYASMLDESALVYRQKRGLADKDEQMALLVQRVSGSYRGNAFFPLMAGVGHSVNLYVWSEQMNAKAGLLRLVYGLGTRAVDRVEGDYPRLVALDQPLLSTYDQRNEDKHYTQQYVDLLNLASNCLQTVHLSDIARESEQNNLAEVAEVDWEQTNRLADYGLKNRQSWVLNFKKILSENIVTRHLRHILEELEKAYAYPVDIEFTINKNLNNQYVINILQCRPLQTRQVSASVNIPDNYNIQNVLIRSDKRFMGGNVHMSVNYVIYIIPDKYVELKEQERYQVARIIGMLNSTLAAKPDASVMLLGPGRWGTTTPSLGIPVRFSEINNMKILGEVAFESAGMMPELSYGSHFFQDLVEVDIFYMALLPHLDDVILRTDLLLNKKNILPALLPRQKNWQSVIHVNSFEQASLSFYSDIKTQRLICLIDS